MFDYARSGDTIFLENGPGAIVPGVFVRCWRQWLRNPTDNPRPVSIDNSALFCEHKLLAFDPNCPTDLDDSLVIIKRADWDALETL